jgi:hypothetical protein
MTHGPVSVSLNETLNVVFAANAACETYVTSSVLQDGVAVGLGSGVGTGVRRGPSVVVALPGPESTTAVLAVGELGLAPNTKMPAASGTSLAPGIG